MQKCPHCGRENSDSDPYCYACGHILPSTLAQAMGATTRLEEAYKRLEPKRRWGTAYFDRQSRLKLTFRDTGESMMVDLVRELEMGREEEEGRERGDPEDRLEAAPAAAGQELLTRILDRPEGLHPSACRTDPRVSTSGGRPSRGR